MPSSLSALAGFYETRAVFDWTILIFPGYGRTLKYLQEKHLGIIVNRDLKVDNHCAVAVKQHREPWV